MLGVYQTALLGLPEPHLSMCYKNHREVDNAWVVTRAVGWEVPSCPMVVSTVATHYLDDGFAQ